MDRVFAHITEFKNLTQRMVEFRLISDNENGGLLSSCLNINIIINRELPPGKTRNIKLSPILRCCRERISAADSKIGILMDGQFTGMELTLMDVLSYARIVINYDWDHQGNAVFCVHGVSENKTTDHVLRLIFFGCMRNIIWDKRPTVLIASMATNLMSSIATNDDNGSLRSSLLFTNSDNNTVDDGDSSDKKEELINSFTTAVPDSNIPSPQEQSSGVDQAELGLNQFFRPPARPFVPESHRHFVHILFFFALNFLCIVRAFLI